MCRGHPAHLLPGERMAVLLGCAVCLCPLYGSYNESVVTRPCCVPACRRGPGPPERLAGSWREVSRPPLVGDRRYHLWRYTDVTVQRGPLHHWHQMCSSTLTLQHNLA